MFWLYYKPIANKPAEPAKKAKTAAPKPSLKKSSKPKVARPAAPVSDALCGMDYSTLSAFNDQAMCVVTELLDCTYLSPQWASLTGVDARKLLGKGLLHQLHTDFQMKFTDRIDNLLRGDSGSERFRCQFKHADGKWHWYDIALSLLPHADGVPQFCCVFRNVMREVEAQKHLQKSRLEAELALKGRSEFLANMSHELRTPLNAVLGFAQIMDNEIFGKINNPKYKDYLGNIQESGHMLLSKIDDLLELANIDAGRIALTEEYADMNEIIRSAIEPHTHHAFSSRITIKKELFPKAVMVKADRVKLKQVVSNLIANALNFSKPGGTVRITAWMGDAGDVRLSVGDSGRGITHQHLKNIREALQQEDSFFARDMNGIGLGLAVVKEFMSLHQGGIDIQSRSNSGCKVTISIPKERVMASSTAKPIPRVKARAAKAPAVKIAAKARKRIYG